MVGNENDMTCEIEMADIEELDDDEDNGDGDDIILFIEYKYCTICHIEQPLRCKHCKQCDHCVSTHDHHCPWIGNCVGERNRLWFFWFLHFQFAQLIVGLMICSQVLLWKGKDDEMLSETNQMLILFLFLITIGFTLFVLPLVFFHTYLVFVNMTSWEFLSWMRITYLKVWPRKYGSPFSKGVLSNLRLFCCFNFRKSKQNYQWKMPTKLPKLKQSKLALK